MNKSLYLLMLGTNFVFMYTVRLIVFYLQRLFPAPRYKFALALDNKIPFIPSWVWVYNGLYYNGILLLNLSQRTLQQFLILDVVLILLIVVHLIFYELLPSSGPEIGRKTVLAETKTEKYLSYIYSLDMNVFCFPSIHASTSMLTAVILNYANLYVAPFAYLFPLLIGISSLFIKQHYFLDILLGWFLGWGFGQFYIYLQ